MKSPKPPDPYATASAQQAAEYGAAATSSIANNPNRYTPWGSQTYTPAGYETVYNANGQPTQVMRYNETQTLSPDQQKLMGLETQQQYNVGQTGVEQSAKLRDLLGKNVDTFGMQGWAGQSNEPTDRAAIEQAMMGRFNQDQAKQSSAQNAQLAARGMAPGSQQWAGVEDTRNRARTDATQQAYLASGAESREQSGFLNQLRQAQLGEKMALRNQPINEIAALLGMNQVQQPQFAGFQGQGVNAAPLGNYIQSNYGQQAQAAANFNQGLFGLAGAGIKGGFGLIK